MPGIQDTPNDLKFSVRIPAEGTAASTDIWGSWVPDFNATVTSAIWVPDVAVTGVVTNNFALQLKDGATGLTTTKTYGSGTNSVANTAETLTVSAAPNNIVAAGDVVTFNRTVNGSGLASPAGLLVIGYRYR